MKPMRTPKDQGLFFTIFFGLTLPVVLFFWILIPSVSPHLHEEEGGEEQVGLERLTKQGAIFRAEHVLKQAGEKLTELEAEAQKEEEEEEKEDEKK